MQSLATFDRYAEAIASPASGTLVALAGYYQPGDAPVAFYQRVATQPDHGFAFQSSDAVWYAACPVDGVDIRWLGARCSSGFDDRAAVLAATDAAFKMKNLRVLFPGGTTYLSGGNYYLRGVTWQGVEGLKVFLAAEFFEGTPWSPFGYFGRNDRVLLGARYELF